MPQALFPTLLGSSWEALPISVRALHGDRAHLDARGRVEVRGDTRWLSRRLRKMLKMPEPIADAPLRVEISRDGNKEVWTRHFPDACLESHLSPSPRWPNAFAERLGGARLTFGFGVEQGQLRWVTRSVRLLGMPLPLRWFEGIDARCSERDGRYRFDIAVRLPLVGLLVAYAGWLEIADAQ
ncbi:MAG: DUF4166 domain-containing protein [Dokdonella sp.]